jgi:hypothetical protein
MDPGICLEYEYIKKFKYLSTLDRLKCVNSSYLSHPLGKNAPEAHKTLYCS